MTIRVNEVLIEDREKRTDLEIHADMCIIGQYALIVHDFNRPGGVVGYDPYKGNINLNF